jgi:hypothetical protein
VLKTKLHNIGLFAKETTDNFRVIDQTIYFFLRVHRMAHNVDVFAKPGHRITSARLQIYLEPLFFFFADLSAKLHQPVTLLISDILLMFVPPAPVLQILLL